MSELEPLLSKNIDAKYGILIAKDLVKRFGDVVAVDGLSIDVSQGEVYCLVGPNGAGKTTTLRMIVGLLRPDRGSVVIDGYDVWTNRCEALMRVSYVPDYPNLPGYLTPLEFLYYVAALRGFKKFEVEESIRYYVDVLNMSDETKKPIRALSRGGLQKTAIAASLVVKPKIVVMDEPLTNIEIDTQVTFKREVLRLAKESSISFLISSHMLPLIEGVCSRVGIINKGKLILEGTMDSVLRAAGEGAKFEDVYMKVLGKSVEEDTMGS
ncbi:MAG: ABC transporter ATP-binding protein [Sulfolobales archaeon]